MDGLIDGKSGGEKKEAQLVVDHFSLATDL